MPPDDRLPPIVVESFSQTREHRRGRPTPTGSVLALHPPGHALADRIANLLVTMKRDYDRTIGTHRDVRPRTHSRVEHRIDRRADAAFDALRCRDTIEIRMGSLRLMADTTQPHYDPFEHEYRLPARLHLPWSWPELPMWLSVGEISSTRGALRLSLRSHKRLRYPIRYFHTAHAVLSRLEAALERT